MEEKENPPKKVSRKTFIPEKYVWKRSYTFVLLANALYIILFYFLMIIFQ